MDPQTSHSTTFAYISELLNTPLQINIELTVVHRHRHIRRPAPPTPPKRKNKKTNKKGKKVNVKQNANAQQGNFNHSLSCGVRPASRRISESLDKKTNVNQDLKHQSGQQRHSAPWGNNCPAPGSYSYHHQFPFGRPSAKSVPTPSKEGNFRIKEEK